MYAYFCKKNTDWIVAMRMEPRGVDFKSNVGRPSNC